MRTPHLLNLVEVALHASSGKGLRHLLGNSLRDEVLHEEPAPISMKPSW
jgi:hypothetical protein